MDSKPTILVVDDEFSIRESFNLILSSNYRVIQAASGEGALKQATDFKIDLAYLDIRMPGMDGIETLQRLKEISPASEVVMVTAVNDVQKAAHAIKLGAHDYLVKPFDVEKILGLTETLLRRKGLLSVLRGISGVELPQLISSSEKMVEISKRIGEISKTNNWVLFVAESGVEKLWAAKLIHQQSGEKKPFISLDLKGLPSSAIERRLFGKKEGITTADLRKEVGIAADAGTLFLDNIKHLPDNIQQRILSLPTRVILSTSHNISDLNLTKELGEKISNSTLIIPPLRERASDIPMLIDYYFDELKKIHSSSAKEMLPAVKDLLSSYNWPGNVDELKAIIERLILILDKPIIEVNDLPLHILISSSSSVTMPLEEIYSGFEGEFIKNVLELNSKDIEKTSRMLHISPQVLEAKI